MRDIAKTTDAAFESDVLKSPKLVLVDFYADWCGPCRALAPALADIAREYADELTVMKLDVDQNGATRLRYGVSGIPTLLLFDQGEVRARLVGLQSRSAIAAEIDKLLSASL